MPARIEDPSDPQYYYCVEYVPDIPLIRMSEEEAALYIAEAAFSEKMIHPTPRELAAHMLGFFATNNECITKQAAAGTAFYFKNETLAGLKNPVDSIMIAQMLDRRRDQPMDTLALYHAYCTRIDHKPSKYDTRHIVDSMRKATETYAPWRPWVYTEAERIMRPPPEPTQLEG
jgi:hypothetical protein